MQASQKRRRLLALIVGVAIVATAASLAGFALAAEPSPREVGVGLIRFKGHGPEYWYNRATLRYRQVKAARKVNARLVAAMRRQQRLILRQPTTRTAIEVAAIVYDQPLDDMMRVAGCETGWTYDPKARNDQPIYNGEHATGLFQFIPSTWASTPFAKFDIYNGWINALAAGWMWANHRRSEWACK